MAVACHTLNHLLHRNGGSAKSKAAEREYFKQGKVEQFKQILEEGSSPEIDGYYADVRYEGIAISNALGAYYSYLGKIETKHREKEDCFIQATKYYNKASNIDMHEPSTWIAKVSRRQDAGNILTTLDVIKSISDSYAEREIVKKIKKLPAELSVFQEYVSKVEKTAEERDEILVELLMIICDGFNYLKETRGSGSSAPNDAYIQNSAKNDADALNSQKLDDVDDPNAQKLDAAGDYLWSFQFNY
ncbi:hypothetical protein OROMI_019974 [Orobanche minor]